MMRKVKVDDQGDTNLITGSIVSKQEFEEANLRIAELNTADGGERRSATHFPLLLASRRRRWPSIRS
jgi:hypothetical protein